MIPSSKKIGLTAYYSYHYFKRSKQLDQKALEGTEEATTAATTTTTRTTSTTTTTSERKRNSGGCCCCGGSHVLSSYIPENHRAQQFSRIANCYDSAIGVDEFFTGINLLRRILLNWHAHGTVLEVGAGTGRNIHYYTTTKKVERVMMVDASETMLEQAKEKIDALQLQQPNRTSSSSTRKGPQFVVKQGNSESLSFCPSHSFDTVVDTFGLCSYDDPVAVLREMVRVCKPNGGKILLLEHGRSKSWSWITKLLDDNQEEHARKWGCIWNRDLDAFLEAVDDILEVQILNTWHFGTTYYIVCQPRMEKPQINKTNKQQQPMTNNNM